MQRRDFLKAAPAALMLAHSAANAATVNKLEPFNYDGVRLRKSRWQEQGDTARQFYISLSDDDILHGFRTAAGLAAPGKPLSGWCAKDCSMVFGQWLSGMARLSRATGDNALRDKAGRLLAEWSKTVKPDGDCRMEHYQFDKLVCGLVDMQLYAGHPQAGPMLGKVTDWASKSLSRSNNPADPSHNTHYYGDPGEWYTLSENYYRAYQLTGDAKYKSFAEVWLYHQYWNKFADTAAPSNAHGVHAYSHVNTMSSAAMAYAVDGDAKYLGIIRNAYDYLQDTQCYATGGYGPNERFMAPDGSLGRALETRSDTCEAVCCSWGGFKLSRYLTQFTGEARYGDWIERLLYNAVGAALPLAPGGRNFYYSDYRSTGGMKVYRWDTFTCCSGTLIQNMADYHNLIYYKDAAALYVNLYMPSEVTWGDVRVVQETGYPDTETSTLTLDMKRSASFPLRFRVPGWASDVSLKVNGAAANVAARPGTWASVERMWSSGDKVEIRIPMRLRMQPVDRQHPNRVAVVRGPVVLALDFDYHDPGFRMPQSDEDLNKWLVPDDAAPSVYRVVRPDGKPVRLKFRPYYQMAEGFPYLMYFDTKAWPFALW